MEEFIKDLLFHFFIMMIIPLVHNLLSRQKKDLNYQIIFMGIIIFTIILTMHFPVTMDKDTEFDLKFIPIFIAFFYGGPVTGIISIFALIINESLTNVTKFPMMVINYGIISILFYYFRKWYLMFSLRKKLLLAFIFYFIISLTRFIVLFDKEQGDLFLFLLVFSLVSYITLAFVIYLIEINELQLFFMHKLQNAEKLNSISQLAASVAHEIRNPMTTIRGFLQILTEDRNLTKEQNMFVSVSLSELDRTQTIIDDFLSLARPNNNEYQLIDISNLLKEITEFMGPYATIAATEISLEIKNDLLITGSAHEFKQLIINLIKNGIEAMPEGGKLKVGAFSEGSNSIITIKDEGIGMAKSQLKLLGQPYYSTKTRGTGLGLLISFDIIKRMQGKIHIESTEQIGTTFTLSFPKQIPGRV